MKDLKLNFLLLIGGLLIPSKRSTQQEHNVISFPKSLNLARAMGMAPKSSRLYERPHQTNKTKTRAWISVCYHVRCSQQQLKKTFKVPTLLFD
jgi:hypothetical protein